MSVPLDQLARIYEERYSLVLEVARRYAPNPSLTRDIAQQAFLVFVQGAREKEWDLDKDVDPLIYGIVKNVARQVWQREQRSAPTALRRVAERFLQPPSEPREFASPGEREPGPRIEALHRCMDKLTQRGRTFLELHYRDGMTIEEIARRHEVNPSTLRQMFSRLRAKLRDCIDNILRDGSK